MKGKRWTAREDEILKQFYRGGVPESWETVKRQLEAEGFKRPRRGIQGRASKLRLSEKDKRPKNPINKGFEIGTIRVVKHSKNNYKYKIIKTSDGWKTYARFLLESNGVTIPPGFVVWFKDGNPLNVVLDNLEVIKRKEIIIRNSKTFIKNQKALQARTASQNLAAGLRPIKIKRGHFEVIEWR